MTQRRECGSCYACCIVLGVSEIKKYSGQTCKKLDAGRCAIYKDRPAACADYYCAWAAGAFTEELQPNKCGFIVTPYETKWVIQIFDSTKCGGLEKGPLNIALQAICNTGAQEIIVLDRKTKQIRLFRDGNIYEGRWFPGEGYENLTFEAYGKPIGKWEMQPNLDHPQNGQQDGATNEH